MKPGMPATGCSFFAKYYASLVLITVLNSPRTIGYEHNRGRRTMLGHVYDQNVAAT